jgi:predicted ATP-dependent endonuclease of OLD family
MCGGETEEIYFNHYKTKHKKDLENINIKVVTHKKSNPLSVVKAALEQRADYDEVWAVFDKDDFTDFNDAITLALDNEINCAFSNEAIEYWFFLHFETNQPPAKAGGFDPRLKVDRQVETSGCVKKFL